MNHYGIFQLRHEDGQVFETIAANFLSRGIKHAYKIADTYASAKFEQYKGLNLYGSWHIYHNHTNKAFVPNQLRVYRGKISGTVSRQVAARHQLTEIKPGEK
jgi:hypothetical protein